MLELPEELNGIHPTFHVSYIRKCLADGEAHVPLDDIELDYKLNYMDYVRAYLGSGEVLENAGDRVKYRNGRLWLSYHINNNYHATTGMSPFEMLYRRRCGTPVCWGSIGYKQLGNLDVVVATMEKLEKLKAFMKAAHDRQKSYADKRRKPIEFEEGDRVMLKYLHGRVSFGFVREGS
ncbi:uncharacterized protein LOC143592800 [Bidens hawaiensis]|uniref:uncharacterized protein LOC143592800 n=1 Tax=Bidens hawaiensis TaxID=980011 RepID=UPI00404A0C6E